MERDEQGPRSPENQAGRLSRWRLDAALWSNAIRLSTFSLQYRILRAVRLNRFLATTGLGSRRHCDELIAAGRVTINGQPCTNFGVQVGEKDSVKVDHRLVRPKETATIMLHKPAGFVSTRSDPHATDTIYDLLPRRLSQLFNIGRLDAQTEGLLLLTNDGELAQRLTHPRYKVEKEYEVTLDKTWDPKLGTKLREGINLDGKRARIMRLHQITPNRLHVVLQQGINRQIRRMFYELGYEVKRLLRIRLGSLSLGDLPRGSWRQVTRGEIERLTTPGKTHIRPSRHS